MGRWPVMSSPGRCKAPSVLAARPVSSHPRASIQETRGSRIGRSAPCRRRRRGRRSRLPWGCPRREGRPPGSGPRSSRELHRDRADERLAEVGHVVAGDLRLLVRTADPRVVGEKQVAAAGDEGRRAHRELEEVVGSARGDRVEVDARGVRAPRSTASSPTRIARGAARRRPRRRPWPRRRRFARRAAGAARGRAPGASW